jgi:rod shape-determining protein MreD
MAILERPGAAASLKFFAALLPFLCGLFGAFFTSIPISILGGAVPPPLLALVPIYYWCLVRPDLMSPATALIIGFVQDVLWGGPPGIWTLSYVVTYALVARQRDSFAGLSGLMAVLGFAMAAFVTCATAWLGVALLQARLPPLGPIVGELAMTVLFYIPAAYVIGLLHHHLVGASRGDI